MSGINNQNKISPIGFFDLLPEEIIQSLILEKLELTDLFSFALTSKDNADSVRSLHGSMKTRATNKLEALKEAAGTLDKLVKDVSDGKLQVLGERTIPKTEDEPIDAYQPFCLDLKTWTQVDEKANYKDIMNTSRERRLDLVEALCELPLKTLKDVEVKLKELDIDGQLVREILKEAMSTAKGDIMMFGAATMRPRIFKRLATYDTPKGTINPLGPFQQCALYNSENSDWREKGYGRLKDYGFDRFSHWIPVQKLLEGKEGERLILKLPSTNGSTPQVIFRCRQKRFLGCTFEDSLKQNLKPKKGPCATHAPLSNGQPQEICEQTCQKAWVAAQKMLGIQPDANNNNNDD